MRWRFAITGLALVAVPAALGAWLLTRPWDGGRAAVPASAPSRLATVSSAPTATPTAPGAPDAAAVRKFIDETPGAWVVERFPAGSTPDRRPGAYALDINSGVLERWTLSTSAPEREANGDLSTYSMSTDGRWIFGQDGQISRVTDRAVGLSWGWSDANFRVVAAGDRIVFAMPGDVLPLAGIYVFDSAMAYVSHCMVRVGPLSQLTLTADGAHLLVITSGAEASGGTGVAATTCDTATGAIHALAAPLDPPGGHFDYAYVSTALRRDAIAIQWVDEESLATSDPVNVRSEYGPDGSLLAVPALPPGVAQFDVSRDGTLVAWDEVSGFETQGEGAIAWSDVVVADAWSGTPLFRIDGAWLNSGIRLQGSRWLADSSGIVVMTAGDPADPGSNGAPKAYGYQVVSRDGSSVRWLPFSSDNYADAPVPSPVTPSVFAIGRARAVDVDTGRTVSAGIDNTFIQDFFGAWSLAGDVLHFVLPLGGHGALRPMLLSSLRIELPPFAADFRQFSVARTGSCLNLRDQPSITGNVIGCLPDGTSVSRSPTAREGTDFLGAADVGPEGRWVRISDGTVEGWASAAYLDFS